MGLSDTIYACGFCLGKTLGRGNNAKVKEAIDIASGERVAIKIMKKSSSAMREAQFLAKLRNQHVIDMKRVIVYGNYVCIVMEIADADLDKDVSECEAKSTFLQMLDSVEFCHENKVAHRDIKYENFKMCEGKVKLLDFGLGRDVSQSRLSRTICGSTNYAAPEIMDRVAYDPLKADIYSLGVTLFYLLTGSEDIAPLQQSNLSESCVELLSKMLAREGERASIQEVRKSEWF